MKFNTAYNPGPSEYEPECPKILQNYTYNSVERRLEKTDKIPFYEEIQSHYESTKLSTKLTRYTMGDITALGCDSGTYSDISGANTNLATVLNTQTVAQSEFEKLPKELRQLFNNSFAEFVGSIEDNSYEKRLTEYIKSKVPEGSGAESGS